MTIGEQIKVARKRKGIRQQQLAGMIGTKASIISRYEHGDILPPVDRLISISEVLEMEFVISCGAVGEGKFPEFDTLPDVSVGTRIKSVREAQGLTQEQLGALAGGIAGSTIRSYEAGRLNPKIETLQRLADALGAPISALKEFGDQQTPENYTIWKNNWPIGEISLFPWQAKQANKQNRGIYFAPKKEQEEE